MSAEVEKMRRKRRDQGRTFMTTQTTTTFVEALEREATEQLDEIRAARIYQGTSPEYRQRAKIAIGVIGAYVRLRATMANEQTNRLVELRMLGPSATALLPAGDSETN